MALPARPREAYQSSVCRTADAEESTPANRHHFSPGELPEKLSFEIRR